MILQAREDIGEPGVWVDVVELGGLDQGVDRSGAVAALVGAGEGPILAAHGNGADLALGRIVRHAYAAVVEEACERHPAGETVSDGLADLALTGDSGALLAQLGLQCDHERPAALVAHAQALLRCQTVDLALDGEQRIDARHGLHGDRRLVEPGEVEELAPRMCPARRLDDRASLASRTGEAVAEAAYGIVPNGELPTVGLQGIHGSLGNSLGRHLAGSLCKSLGAAPGKHGNGTHRKVPIAG